MKQQFLREKPPESIAIQPQQSPPPTDLRMKSSTSNKALNKPTIKAKEDDNKSKSRMLKRDQSSNFKEKKVQMIV